MYQYVNPFLDITDPYIIDLNKFLYEDFTVLFPHTSLWLILLLFQVFAQLYNLLNDANPEHTSPFTVSVIFNSTYQVQRDYIICLCIMVIFSSSRMQAPQGRDLSLWFTETKHL